MANADMTLASTWLPSDVLAEFPYGPWRYARSRGRSASDGTFELPYVDGGATSLEVELEDDSRDWLFHDLGNEAFHELVLGHATVVVRMPATSVIFQRGQSGVTACSARPAR